MSEVDLKQEVEEQLEQEQEQPEYSETELQAMDEGWIPPDRFNPEEQGKDFVSAEKFLENGSFFKKIKSLKTEVDGLKTTISKINDHNRKVAEREQQKLAQEYEAQIARLKAEKVQALEEGDHRRVVEIDDQMRQTPEPKTPEPEVSPVYENWIKENDWYNKDDFLSDEADVLASEYKRRNLPPEVALPRITEHLMAKYPEKFKKTPAHPSVEGGGHKPRSTKGISEKDLTSDEMQVFRNLNVSNYFKSDADKKQYIKDVIALRD